MYNQKLNTIYSWGSIVIFLFCFWPIGLFLLYKRISLDKAAALKNSKGLQVVGWIMIALGVFAFFGDTTDGGGVGVLFVFGLGGACLLIVSKRLKKNGNRYRHYIGMIVNQGERSIDKIAGVVGVTYDVARKDLQKMIDTGFFKGAYINDSSHEFLLPQQRPMPVPPVNRTTNMGNAQGNQTKVVACAGCGANNTVLNGQTKECDYCGAPVNG